MHVHANVTEKFLYNQFFTVEWNVKDKQVLIIAMEYAYTRTYT